MVRLEQGRKMSATVAVFLDGVVDIGRAAVQPLFDDLVAPAKLGLQHAGPAHVRWKSPAPVGTGAPGVRIAETDDDLGHMYLLTLAAVRPSFPIPTAKRRAIRRTHPPPSRAPAPAR